MSEYVRNTIFGLMGLFILVFVYYSKVTEDKIVENKPNKFVFPKSLVVLNYTHYEIDTLTKTILYNVLGYDRVLVEFKYMPDELIYGAYILKGHIVKDLEHSHSYTVYVSKYLREIEFIPFITHELIHLDQFETGELIQPSVFTNYMIYKGDTINLLQTSYQNRDYEINAFERENEVFLALKELLYK